MEIVSQNSMGIRLKGPVTVTYVKQNRHSTDDCAFNVFQKKKPKLINLRKVKSNNYRKW